MSAPNPVNVAVHNNRVWVQLADQRIIGLPLDAFPWLKHATPDEQHTFQMSPTRITWPDLDNAIDMDYFTSAWKLAPDT